MFDSFFEKYCCAVYRIHKRGGRIAHNKYNVKNRKYIFEKNICPLSMLMEGKDHVFNLYEDFSKAFNIPFDFLYYLDNARKGSIPETNIWTDKHKKLCEDIIYFGYGMYYLNSKQYEIAHNYLEQVSALKGKDKIKKAMVDLQYVEP